MGILPYMHNTNEEVRTQFTKVVYQLLILTKIREFKYVGRMPLLLISENEFMHVDLVVTISFFFSFIVIIRGRGCAHDRHILVSFFSSRMNKKKIDNGGKWQ